MSLLSFAEEPLKVRDFRMTGDGARVRVEMKVDRDFPFKTMLLRAPHRIAVDIPGASFLIDPQSLKPTGLVRNVQFGALEEGSSRLVLTADGPFIVERIETVPNDGEPGLRLVIDLAAATVEAFEQALADQALTTGATSAAGKSNRLTGAARQRFVVVIDPGHGGFDGGAEGVNGTVEKDVTLTFAKELRDRLASSGKFNVYMTRETDVFLPLDERVRIARQHGANLFISIHADTIKRSQIRGATVYTVSDRASDAEAQATADRENLSDALAGITFNESNHEVADILVDLIRRETHAFSVRFARALIDELSPAVGLINNPHRSAGFKVLRAPDVPSVLIELGYLSNSKDEALLLDPAWRSKVINRMISAIDLFASAWARAGG